MSSPYFQQADDLFLSALASIPGLGPSRLGRLREKLGSWQKAFEAGETSWRELKIPENSIAVWRDAQSKFVPEKLIDYLSATQTYLITPEHEKYFAGFKDLDDAPLLLYARGSWPATESIITVIGSRRPSNYGEIAAQHFVPTLARNHVSIASGLATGLDKRAHELALETNGHTIAILGSGLDNIYPRENIALSNKIIKAGGLIISEYPPSASPLKAHFIGRNRLLAAIAQKVLILEAGLKSGSILTARLALILKRPLYAVPGNIFNEQAAGCHELLKEGANVAIDASSLLADPQLSVPEKASGNSNLSPLELKIINIIKARAQSFQKTGADDIVFSLKLDSASVNSTLSILEIKNIVRKHSGKYEIRSINTEY